MKVNRAYKTELKPNKSQLQLLEQHAGTARFTYNWGLNLRIQAHKNGSGEKLNSISLHKKLTSLKKKEFPWMYEVSKCAPQEALRDLDKSYEGFFRRVKKGETPGFPKFKSKHNSNKSFRLYGVIKILEAGAIQLPVLGKLRLKEKNYFPQKGVKIISATVSSRAGRWFVSLSVEEEILNSVVTISSEVIGIDLGIKTLAVTSEGNYFNNPKALNSKLKKLKKFSRKHSKKKRGSKNRKKSSKKLAKLHYKIYNIRKDSIHKMTTQLVKAKPTAIVIEDLAVKNMLKNRRLSRSLADSSFGEIRRQLDYKCGWTGIDLVVVDRFFPSSKTCSSCGNVKAELKLSERVYKCENCDASLCRDLNAAYNLRNYYFEHNAPTSSSGESNACGDAGLLASLKQEMESGLSSIT